MNIRPAIDDDVELVLPMVAKTCAMHQAMDPAKYGFKPNPADMYRNWLHRNAHSDRAVFLVAEREGAAAPQPAQLAGFLIATLETEIPIYRLKEYGFIHDIFVEEPYRHEGIARQMVMLAIEKFREMGAAQVRLDVLIGNAPARGLFAACGFRASTMEMLMELA